MADEYKPSRPPRGAPAPADSDVEEWAENERKRRQAWLNGPSETEKRIWALRRSERLAASGDPVGTTDEEVDAWAQRERRRRQAWAEGPTEDEKVRWSVERDYVSTPPRSEAEP